MTIFGPACVDFLSNVMDCLGKALILQTVVWTNQHV